MRNAECFVYFYAICRTILKKTEFNLIRQYYEIYFESVNLEERQIDFDTVFSIIIRSCRGREGLRVREIVLSFIGTQLSREKFNFVCLILGYKKGQR